MSYITHSHSWEHIPPEFAHLTAHLSKTPRSTEQIGRKCSFFSSGCYKNASFEDTTSRLQNSLLMYLLWRENMLTTSQVHLEFLKSLHIHLFDYWYYEVGCDIINENLWFFLIVPQKNIYIKAFQHQSLESVTRDLRSIRNVGDW